MDAPLPVAPGAHFADVLARRARLTPAREALLEVQSGRRFTFAELDARADRAAALLRDRYHVGRGDRVGIVAGNGVPYVDLLHGLARLGAILVPFNWRLKPAEIAHAAADCAPTVVLHGREHRALGEAAARAAATTSAVAAVPTLDLDDDTAGWEALLAATPRVPVAPPADLGGDDPLCILYTSGTTGRAKGAVIPHRQVLWNCINTAVSWGLREDDCAPVFTPLFHAGALFVFLTPLHYLGGRVVLEREFDADRSLALIARERCTVVLGVPTLFRMWREAPSYPAADLSSVRFFVNGGAAIAPELMRAFREEKSVAVRQGYGLTEVGVNCMTMTSEEALTRGHTVGKPIFHADARIVDESGDEVAPGRAGELCLRGPHVCLGYWRNPEATAAAIRDGWFHTGDMAERDADGFITIRGRYKDMIKSGGENVYAAEVEAVFREHPAVLDCALIGKPDPRWEEVGLMVVVLRAGEPSSAVDAAALTAFARERLANYKVPREVVFAEALPYSPYGKVVKADLRARYLG